MLLSPFKLCMHTLYHLVATENTCASWLIDILNLWGHFRKHWISLHVTSQINYLLLLLLFFFTPLAVKAVPFVISDTNKLNNLVLKWCGIVSGLDVTCRMKAYVTARNENITGKGEKHKNHGHCLDIFTHPALVLLETTHSTPHTTGTSHTFFFLDL